MNSDIEEMLRAARELDERLQFRRAYMDRKLSPEIVRAIKEAQVGGEARTVGEALDVAKRAGWRPDGAV